MKGAAKPKKMPPKPMPSKPTMTETLAQKKPFFPKAKKK